ncbi:hypothetical protein ACFQE1_00985 [Halobium palmae]|uniref:Sec-independent protein translocase protein TatA n=1 Tax=Halobium palmae TaxID=1776492 RepID=A0ABD5RUP9_9EURY
MGFDLQERTVGGGLVAIFLLPVLSFIQREISKPTSEKVVSVGKSVFDPLDLSVEILEEIEEE